MTSEPEISVFRPDRPGIRKVLGDLEAEIMELVWSRPEGSGTTVRDVFEVLYERRLSDERRLVERILENLYVNFSGATLEGLQALPNQEAANRVRQQLDEISRRRAVEEGE